MPNLNSDIRIIEIGVWMDGGSLTVKCANTEGENYSIEFHQNAILRSSSEGKMPGRIYVRDILIEERSDKESLLLHKLETAISLGNLKPNLTDRNILEDRIKYVRSEKYLINNRRIEEQRSILLGREFDWIARDCDGQFGLFSSAGYGRIPMNVIEDYKSHEDIMKHFSLPNNGTINVWDDFSSYGFYVFDWQLNEGPYIIKSMPTSEMSKELESEIDRIRSVINFDFTFKNINKIEI